MLYYNSHESHKTEIEITDKGVGCWGHWLGTSLTKIATKKLKLK